LRAAIQLRRTPPAGLEFSYAALRSPSTLRNQFISWFELVKIWATVDHERERRFSTVCSPALLQDRAFDLSNVLSTPLLTGRLSAALTRGMLRSEQTAPPFHLLERAER